MADERGIAAHVSGSEDDRFADSEVTGLTPVHQSGLGNVNLLDFHAKRVHLPKQSVNLLLAEAGHVVGRVLGALAPELARFRRQFVLLRDELRFPGLQLREALFDLSERKL